MDIISVIVAAFAILTILYFLFGLFIDGFCFNTLMIMLIIISLTVGSVIIYKQSKTDVTYLSYTVTSVNDKFFRISQKECIIYSLGTDRCKVVEEKLIIKSEIFNN